MLNPLLGTVRSAAVLIIMFYKEYALLCWNFLPIIYFKLIENSFRLIVSNKIHSDAFAT